MEADFLYNPSGCGPHAHGASLALRPNGDLLCAWFAYPGSHDYQGGRIVVAHKPTSSPSWPVDCPLSKGMRCN